MLVYYIDVVCDGIGCAAPLVSAPPALTHFTGLSWSDCYVQARRHGWTLSLKSALCPYCSSKRLREQQKLLMANGGCGPLYRSQIEKRRST